VFTAGKFGTSDNVSVAVFQCKPRMVKVEFELIILSLIIFFYKEELLDAYECKLNIACTLFECSTLIHHLLY